MHPSRIFVAPAPRRNPPPPRPSINDHGGLPTRHARPALRAYPPGPARSPPPHQTPSSRVWLPTSTPRNEVSATLALETPPSCPPLTVLILGSATAASLPQISPTQGSKPLPSIQPPRRPQGLPTDGPPTMLFHTLGCCWKLMNHMVRPSRISGGIPKVNNFVSGHAPDVIIRLEVCRGEAKGSLHVLYSKS